jgi:hypothetical protein
MLSVCRLFPRTRCASSLVGAIRRRDDSARKAKHAAAVVAVYDHLVDRFI